MGRQEGLFPRDAVIRRVNGESALLLGGGRAVLMQIAHPAVAAGVAEHSGFEADPFARLRRTLDAMYTIVYGSTDDASRTAAALHKVHERVTGDGYRANDPALLLWVHATLVDTALRVHTRFIRPLDEAEAEEYYSQSVTLAEVLGVPREQQPEDLRAFRAYVRTMVATVEVTDDARRLAVPILHPPVPLVSEPAFALARQITVGLLPLPLRTQYGFGWDRHRKAALLAAGAAARLALPRLPAQLRRASA